MDRYRTVARSIVFYPIPSYRPASLEQLLLMTTTIFDKTDKGRDEIATRGNHLPARLRTLLLLVDGKRDTVELMAKVAGLGLDEKSLVELLEGEFIQVAGSVALARVAPIAAPTVASADMAPVAGSGATAAGTPAAPAVPAASAATAPTFTPATLAPASATGQAAAAEVADSVAPAGTAAQSDVDAAVAGILRDGETQFQALYNFFNETIRSVIGLRGFTMQLKVERAVTIADFRLLRPAYLEAVLKAKGPEMERSLRDRLDQLLGLGD